MTKRVLQSLLLLIAVMIVSCNEQINRQEIESLDPIDWSDKTTTLPEQDSLSYGKTYLSVYSQIYSYTQHTSLDLTATVSIRNTSEIDTIYLLRADYFDTHGNPIYSYVKNPIALNKTETLEIVIAESDKTGGTGANFIFDWAKKPATSEPIFEAVMISAYGQQGLSFTTQGKRVK
jgi:hypothetical protein